MAAPEGLGRNESVFHLAFTATVGESVALCPRGGIGRRSLGEGVANDRVPEFGSPSHWYSATTVQVRVLPGVFAAQCRR